MFFFVNDILSHKFFFGQRFKFTAKNYAGQEKLFAVAQVFKNMIFSTIITVMMTKIQIKNFDYFVDIIENFKGLNNLSRNQFKKIKSIWFYGYSIHGSK